MWQDIYLEVDDNGYIKNPNINLIKGNIRLKLNSEHKNIKIGKDFLRGCIGLKELDLSGLQNVTSIGNNFLSYCIGLKELNSSGLQNVKSIGSCFLSNCSGLKEIDLSLLQNIKSIGVFFDGDEHFLDDCKGLEIIRCKGKIKELIGEKYLLSEELIEKKVIDNKIYINDSIKIEI